MFIRICIPHTRHPLLRPRRRRRLTRAEQLAKESTMTNYAAMQLPFLCSQLQTQCYHMDTSYSHCPPTHPLSIWDFPPQGIHPHQQTGTEDALTPQSTLYPLPSDALPLATHSSHHHQLRFLRMPSILCVIVSAQLYSCRCCCCAHLTQIL